MRSRYENLILGSALVVVNFVHSFKGSLSHLSLVVSFQSKQDLYGRITNLSFYGITSHLKIDCWSKIALLIDQ